jgi:hypothetical protein
MGRKDRRQSTTISEIEFSVSDTQIVLQKCENCLKSSLDKRPLKFIEVFKNSEKYIFALLARDSTGMFTTDDRNKRHHIVPLLAVGADTYWLNLSLTFLPKFTHSKQEKSPREFQFSGASIRIFKGLATEDKKEPLFRAEWDLLKKDNNHAQPHWHVYKSFQTRDINNKGEDFESLIESNEAQDFGEVFADFSAGNEGDNFLAGNMEGNNLNVNQEILREDEWDSATKFHFAMASQWHTPEGTHRFILAQDAHLYSWLTGCIQYIKEQLSYVSGSR